MILPWRKRGQSPDSPTRTPAGLLLVAEDSRANQIVTVHLLETLGYRAHVVSSGREAVEAFRPNRYVAVLMDLSMPQMDGFDATEGIRRRERKGAHVPVIAMSRDASPEIRDRARNVGFDDFLAKPVDPEALRTALQRWAPTPTDG